MNNPPAERQQRTVPHRVSEPLVKGVEFGWDAPDESLTGFQAAFLKGGR